MVLLAYIKLGNHGAVRGKETKKIKRTKLTGKNRMIVRIFPPAATSVAPTVKSSTKSFRTDPAKGEIVPPEEKRPFCT